MSLCESLKYLRVSVSLISVFLNFNLYVLHFCSGVLEKILNILLPYCQNLRKLKNDLANTLLHEAAISGIPQIVRTTLDHIAKFLQDSVDSFGNNSMHDAVQKGQIEMVKGLLERLSKPNAQNQFLLSPLHIAVNKYAKITKLERNGTKSKTENAGTYTEIVKLISFSCDNHDCQDFDGNTTLHIAAREGLIEIVEILMPFYENLLIENVREETPLTLAYGRDDSIGDSIRDLLMKEIESRCQ